MLNLPRPRLYDTTVPISGMVRLYITTVTLRHYCTIVWCGRALRLCQYLVWSDSTSVLIFGVVGLYVSTVPISGVDRLYIPTVPIFSVIALLHIYCYIPLSQFKYIICSSCSSQKSCDHNYFFSSNLVKDVSPLGITGVSQLICSK